LRRVEKAPLNRARHAVHQARADAGSRRLLLDRRRDLGQKLRSLVLVDRRGQREQQIHFFGGEASGMGGSGRGVAHDWRHARPDRKGLASSARKDASIETSFFRVPVRH